MIQESFQRTQEPAVTWKYFYLFAAVLGLAFVLAGFSVGYIIPVAKGTSHHSALVHAHGAIFFLWILFSVAQPWLVRSGKINIHRKLGVIGFSLAVIMIIFGVTIALYAAQRDIGKGLGDQARSFLLIPLSDIFLFATYISLAIASLKNRESHKRLMVLATMSILPAAFGRLFVITGIASNLTIPTILLALIIQECILFIGIILELCFTRKVHRVYMVGGSLIIFVHLARIPAGASDTWLRLVKAILG